ncbi:amidohydrolase family protein [Demequina sp.]|uniref:amidohydrolase family protein n=1 Tax=Demequina sp. TaxID=2050685 RepID=UPI003A893827
MSVIDSHLHVWDLARAEYPWLTAQLAPIDRTLEVADAAPRLEALGVERAVLVQAADNDQDTEHMMDVAAADARVAGVVVWVPLDSPEQAVHRLAALAARGPVVGVRALIHDMADPDWIVSPAVTDGLAAVADAGLAFDFVCADPQALRHVPVLAQRDPDLAIVIDHLGKPPVGGASGDREPATFAQWMDLLADATASAQVSAKLSGLYRDGLPEPRAVTAVVEAALDIVGPQRLMIGSDWPICELSGGLERAWGLTTAALASLTDHDRDLVMGVTATRVYGLSPTTSKGDST